MRFLFSSGIILVSMTKGDSISKQEKTDKPEKLAGAEKRVYRLDEGYEGEPPDTYKPLLPEEANQSQAVSPPPQETQDE